MASLSHKRVIVHRQLDHAPGRSKSSGVRAVSHSFALDCTLRSQTRIKAHKPELPKAR